jgi:hypothetical protein
MLHDRDFRGGMTTADCACHGQKTGPRLVAAAGASLSVWCAGSGLGARANRPQRHYASAKKHHQSCFDETNTIRIEIEEKNNLLLISLY